MCMSKPPTGIDLIRKLHYFVNAFEACVMHKDGVTLDGIRKFIHNDAGPEDAALFTTTMWTILSDLPFRRSIDLSPTRGGNDLLEVYSRSATLDQLMEIGYALHSLRELEIAEDEKCRQPPTPKSLNISCKLVPLRYLEAWVSELRRVNKGVAIPDVEAVASQIEAHTR